MAREIDHVSGQDCTLLMDARLLSAAGLGRYLRAILVQVLAEPRFSGVTLLGRTSELEGFVPAHERAGRVRLVEYPWKPYSPGAQIAWTVLQSQKRLKADVSFFPHYDAPFLGMPARSVVAVHDLTHFKVPEAFPAWQRTFGGRLLDRVISRAARVITVSESTKRDLVERLPDATPKVDVVLNGVNPVFGRVAPAELPSWISAQRPYLLCVGNRKPHKNLAAAVEALAILRRDRPDLRLAFAGGHANNGWDTVLQRAREVGVHDAVIDLPQVSDEELRALYAGCEVFLFPSLYEGFGLPVLEAMASGAPVVSADGSSLPEVVGDAGLLVNPRDRHALACAVRRVLDEQGLRERLIRRGLTRAASLTEERAARRTVEILLEVAGGKASPTAPRALADGGARVMTAAGAGGGPAPVSGRGANRRAKETAIQSGVQVGAWGTARQRERPSSRAGSKGSDAS